MVLTPEEKKCFFTNWFKLLFFVNEKYHIYDDVFSYNDFHRMDIKDTIKVRNKLWNNIFLIDKYLKKADLNEEDKHLVRSWKKCVKSTFVIMEDLQEYSVVLDPKKEIIYGVVGISDPISYILPDEPVMFKTVLIPFKDKIICDGLVAYNNADKFTFDYNGPFYEQYRELRNECGVVTQIE